MLAGFRLIIFDADDTLRRTTAPGQPCPHRADEWELLPNVRSVLARLPWSDADGPRLGLASNQDHIGYGYLSLKAARALLRDAAAAATGVVPPDAALQLCPHVLEIDCECRKPKPAMLLRIMEHYGVEPERTVLVGNADTDRQAAEAAGVAFLPASEVFGWR
jgi:D-glycero-D-manno-heptose 1,7-bisphosphate phosphatase